MIAAVTTVIESMVFFLPHSSFRTLTIFILSTAAELPYWGEDDDPAVSSVQFSLNTRPTTGNDS